MLISEWLMTMRRDSVRPAVTILWFQPRLANSIHPYDPSCKNSQSQTAPPYFLVRTVDTLELRARVCAAIALRVGRCKVLLSPQPIQPPMESLIFVQFCGLLSCPNEMQAHVHTSE